MTAAAAELAYAPGARRCAGAVVARLDDGFTAIAVGALARELARLDTPLILTVSDGTPEMTAARVGELRARGAGCIAFCGAAVPAVPQSQTVPPRVPFVSLDGSGAPDAGIAPAFSRAQSLVLGVLYLAALGHVKVALLDVPDPATVRSVKERGAARGVEVVDHSTAGRADEPALAAMLQRWRSEEPRMSAAVCGSDRTAAALLRACRQTQTAVPGEVAVIGFGDSELSRQTRPGLTSLRISPAEAGVALGERLAAAFAGRNSDAAPLAAKLVVRESTASRVP